MVTGKHLIFRDGPRSLRSFAAEGIPRVSALTTEIEPLAGHKNNLIPTRILKKESVTLTFPSDSEKICA
jgi:hypothetical protein